MTETPLTDEYIVKLLEDDAIAVSGRTVNSFFSSKYVYINLLDNFNLIISNRPPADKPKPNTRFLQNIIQSTDSHNAYLLEKERRESKIRIDREKNKNKRRERDDRAIYSVRERFSNLESNNKQESDGRERVEKKDRYEKQRERSRDYNRSSRRDRSRSPDRQYTSSKSTKRERDVNEIKRDDSQSNNTSEMGPQVENNTKRGRGDMSSKKIDDHFKPNYDPSVDKRIPDMNDMMEEYRNRQRIKSRQFSNQNTEMETEEGIVRWNKIGEDREWDRGKIL